MLIAGLFGLLIYVNIIARRLQVAERLLSELYFQTDLSAGSPQPDQTAPNQAGSDQAGPTTPTAETEPLAEFAEPQKQPRIITLAAKPVRDRSEKAVSNLIPGTEEPQHSEERSLSFEELVGGKLPIWIGGISLVFAAFFLVRYSIEAGLLGPAARSVLAAVFAGALIGLSEYGSRLPKVGGFFSSDKRIGQSLAGAGIAIAYGTLYMASEIYGLMGVVAAFILVVAVTGIAFALSLRQGPPTALMGIVGGFAAPWVAGLGADNMPVVLLYLAVFIAAVFGLAVRRRWLWLLLLASGGGIIWTASLVFLAEADFALLGLFIMASGIGAVFALQRFGDASGPFAEAARYVPMGAALVQMVLLLSRMEFSIFGWLYFGALSAASLALSWRDRRMLPLSAAALILALTALTAAWHSSASDTINLIVSAAIILLFGAPAYWRGTRDHADSNVWAGMAATATVGTWCTGYSADVFIIGENGFALIAAALAGALAPLAYANRHQGITLRWISLLLATAGTAFLALAAMLIWLPQDRWAAAAILTAALAISAWARRLDGNAVRRLAIVPLVTGTAASAVSGYAYFEMLLSSLAGERALYGLAPQIEDAFVWGLIPAAMMLAITWQPWFAAGLRTRRLAQIAGGVGIGAFVYLLVKQPAAIDSAARFINSGFAERMAITQALALLGWLSLRTAAARPAGPALSILGWALGGLALLRFGYYDLLLLNPVFAAQSFGPAPVANLGTLHCALMAGFCWLYARFDAGTYIKISLEQPLRIASLGSMILAVLITIRHLARGSIIAGPNIANGENYLYSAGLLALSIGWLAFGMRGGSKLLRIAGLALLTAVTLKVFLIDAASLEGLLRIFSFLGLGIALIGIGWAYGRVMDIGPAQDA